MKTKKHMWTKLRAVCAWWSTSFLNLTMPTNWNNTMSRNSCQKNENFSCIAWTVPLVFFYINFSKLDYLNWVAFSDVENIYHQTWKVLSLLRMFFVFTGAVYSTGDANYSFFHAVLFFTNFGFTIYWRICPNLIMSLGLYIFFIVSTHA